MAATLTATVDPDLGRVLVTFTGATVGDRLQRDGVDVRYPPVTSAAGIIADFEAQPGQPHTYSLSGGTVTVTPNPDQACDGALLVHPTDPTLSLKVKVRDDNPNEWDAPGTLHEVMGQRAPLVTHTQRTYHTGTLVFWTPWATRPQVIALFEDGTPILVNPPTCCPLEYEWTWGRLVAEKIDPTGSSGIWWTYDYNRVGIPAGYVTRPDVLPNTWAGVNAEPSEPTWTALVANHATWADVVTTVHPHGGTP